VTDAAEHRVRIGGTPVRKGERIITPEGYAGSVVTTGVDGGVLVRLEVWYEPEELHRGR
jgi:hypothetical protein